MVADSVTPWITSASLSLASQSTVAVANSSFTYTLPALSVVTFVGQTIAAPPTLNVAEQGGNIILSWSTNSPGFNLEYSTDLTSTNWTTALPMPTIVGDQNVVATA